MSISADLSELRELSLNALPAELRQPIENYITARLGEFVQALIERGQIKPVEPLSVTARYTED
jgi:hypothetical protein